MAKTKSKHGTKKTTSGVSQQYRYRRTYGLKAFDVQAVGARIYEIRERDGGVQPAVVLDEARDTLSVLHPPFEWDDSSAAEGYRLWQARQLVRNVVLVRTVVEDGETVEHEVPLVHVPGVGDAPARYDSEDALTADAASWTRAYEDALSSLRIAQRRIAELEAMTAKSEHADQVSVIRVALKGLETAQVALERLH